MNSPYLSITDAGGKTVTVPKTLLEKLLDWVDELEDELKEYREENEYDKPKIRQQVTDAVESERSESPVLLMCFEWNFTDSW